MIFIGRTTLLFTNTDKKKKENNMKFFSPEGALYKFITIFWNLVKINVVWLLCCIPIVTIGPSTIAAFAVTMQMAQNTEGYVVHTFFKEFKKNIKGIPMGLLFVLCLEVANVDFQLFNQIEGNPFILLVFGIVAVFVLLMSFTYAFALYSRYENSVMRTLKLSFEISTKYIGRTLILWVLIVLELFAIFYNYTTMFCGVLFGGSVIFYTISGFAVKVFAKIEEESKN